MSKLTINLVVYNGEKYIPYLFVSLKRQSFKDWELIFVDNASTDRTLELVEAELKDSGISYQIIKNQENFGFSFIPVRIRMRKRFWNLKKFWLPNKTV
ncbi:MAG: Glycosyl transferase family 2 [Candidatus Magasanikbacteria bacterium GW2011_GWA2_37_8]|uniref:Glycosyl transferase family 2 n=1 Tax=Candidatus Magasanikbacteria bacterium GW2011_GWA2_37_8 TaxID=1619036 RepID=A0A0G0HA95_9BACT|nr:MAG: Glycosyl transferase family 2 [Candidatus Magasanikbacteria bacterium GW2011_GWA2_37_8]